MELLLLAFARTRDELGFAERTVASAPEETPRELLARLAPALDLSVIRIAVDREYRDADAPIGYARELALIPPVSGG